MLKFASSLFAVMLLTLFACMSLGSANTAGKINVVQFKKLMQTVSTGWNEGDAKKAVDCFTIDALYLEPPDKQFYAGRNAIYEFFGGNKKPDPPMRNDLASSRL